jgi:curved DNA-binding protein CbpA
MGTLYDLLGALPNDDAEGLRNAFRKAAKATHPDINPDDPDASLRFRQLVRAHDILSDVEQRATYDELLAFALQQPGSNSRRPTIYQTIHKHASNTLAATIISAMLIGGYTLFGHVSKAFVIPESVTEAAVIPKKMIEAAPRKPAEIAAIAPPAPQPDASGQDEARDKRDSIEPPDGMIVASAVAPAASPQATANVGPAARPAMNDARSYRARGTSAYREGDLDRALADFDRAIQRDPNFADAYIDRSIVLYRMRAFDRAFADIAQARRIGHTSRTRISAPAPRRASPVQPRDSTNDY